MTLRSASRTPAIAIYRARAARRLRPRRVAYGSAGSSSQSAAGSGGFVDEGAAATSAAALVGNAAGAFGADGDVEGEAGGEG